MSFSPFAILTAEEMNDLVENIESLADGTGFDTGAVGPASRSGGFKTGTFSKGTTGNIAVTGVGFQPKFVEFFFQPTSATGSIFSMTGAADGTSQNCTGVSGATTPTMARWSSTSACINVRNAAGTSISVATLVSFDAGGFTLNFSTADSGASDYSYRAYA